MMLRPVSAIRLVSNEPVKKTFGERLRDYFFPEQAETPETEPPKMVLKPTADPAPFVPFPTTYGSVRVPGTITTWDGEIMTSTMMKPDQPCAWWYCDDHRVPNCNFGHKVLDKHEVTDWNDMTEDEREEAINEWEKLMGLSSIGITPPTPEGPNELAAARMHQRAVANNLARDMEAHKKKLERELAEAEERERLYEGNSTFGAF
jgi:hypothetical protein